MVKERGAMALMSYPVVEARESSMAKRLKAVPWIRILVDAALVAAILVVASNFLTVH